MGYSECDTMKYAAAYIRVSDDRQDEYSPDSQLRLIKEYASKNDYDIPEEYVFYDDGISGRSTKKRKAFNEMIAFATSKDHPVEAIIVWKFSRFARSRRDSVIFKDLLRKNGVAVKSVSEDIGESELSPIMEGLLEGMDEYYSVRLSGEVKRGMKEKINRGEPVSVAPFGYKNESKRYVPDENAEFVKYIFNAYLAGDGFRKIAIYLQSQGVKTRRGNYPDNRFVEYVLSNPTYNGKIRWSENGKEANGKRYKGDSEYTVVDGTHEAIIDDDTWNKVQEKLAEQKRRYGKWQRREQPIEYMLKGLVRCDTCGATLVHVSLKEPAMQCHNYARGQCKVSHHLSIKKANEAVIDRIGTCLESVSFDIIPKDDNKTTQVDYDTLIKKELEKIKRASDAYDAGFDTLEEYGRKKRAYQNKIDELEAMKNAQNKIEKQQISYDFIQKVKQVYDIIISDSESEQAKNEALRTIIDHITYEKTASRLKVFFYI